jgi:hypothetical protein
MRKSHCVIAGVLLAALISAVGGWKLYASAGISTQEARAEAAAPANPLVGIWKSSAGDKANDHQPKDGLALTFRNDGTMEMTARITMGGPHSGSTWHCQGRYQFDGDTLERNFSSCTSCPVGGSCIEQPLSQISDAANADFRISFLASDSLQIGTAILFADKRK